MTEKTIATRTRKAMAALGVYHEEFEPIIAIYAGLMRQYDVLNTTFVASGYDFAEETQQGTKKAPIVTTLEALRKDIICYGAQLGLTPAGLRKINDGKLQPPRAASPLDAMLHETG